MTLGGWWVDRGVDRHLVGLTEIGLWVGEVGGESMYGTLIFVNCHFKQLQKKTIVWD